MRLIKAKTSLRNYPIYIEKDILDKVPLLIKKHFKDYSRIVLITNETILEIYKDKIIDLCKSTTSNYEIITLKDGEEYKNLDSAELIYSKLIKSNIHRNDIIIPFGGGVIGDIGGYTAATFHRGVKLVHIPTTIIAQVDSSIGGKVVVNYKGIKNVIGSFYQPHMIIMDPVLLTSLDEKQIINGLGEIVKYGLVFDKNILCRLKKIVGDNKDNLQRSIGYKDFEDIIYRCALIKTRVVEKDEFDTGYRNLLNFGHTIGHSIENAGRLKDINHGQAVAMGMIVAIDISIRLGYLNESMKKEVESLYKRLRLPSRIPDIDVDTILNALKYDKKFTGNSNKFILLKNINRPFFYNNLKTEIIIESINNCMNK